MKMTLTSKGSFAKTVAYLNRVGSGDIFRSLSRHGERGRAALAGATPQDSGKTANSWTYEVRQRGSSWEIVWSNTNVVNGLPIAILLQYGHGTGTGGYVQGRDYINPAIQPVMDQIAKDVWKEVTRG